MYHFLLFSECMLWRLLSFLKIVLFLAKFRTKRQIFVKYCAKFYKILKTISGRDEVVRFRSILKVFISFRTKIAEFCWIMREILESWNIYPPDEMKNSLKL